MHHMIQFVGINHAIAVKISTLGATKSMSLLHPQHR